MDTLTRALRAVERAANPDTLYDAHERLYAAAKAVERQPGLAVTATILDHVPSLTEKDENEISDRLLGVPLIGEEYFDHGTDIADLALRTCRCGVTIDGYYQYVDHLVTVFGGESHIGG